MKKIIKLVLLLALVALVIIQFIRPEKNQSSYEAVAAFESELKPSAEVAGILKTNCYDCHSDYTVYPWYSNITPVNYWMENHINHGKGHLNLSKWTEYSVGKKAHKMEEIIELVESRSMPLSSYTWGHSDAKLSQEQIDAVISWANQMRIKYELAPKPE